MSFLCILFDLDGTIVNTKEGITRCVEYSLSHFGITVKNRDELEVFIGPPLHKSFQMFYGFDEEKSMEAVSKYRERYKDVGIFECNPYEGIVELIKELFKKNYYIGLATSKPEEYAIRILEKFKILEYFNVVTGSNMDGSRTEKDEVIREALERFEAFGREDEFLMIGDKHYDIDGAKKNGIKTIGVSYGFAIGDELIEAGADYIVEFPFQIKEILDKEEFSNGEYYK